MSPGAYLLVAKVLNSTVELDTSEKYVPGLIDAYFPSYSKAYLKSSEIKEMFAFRGSDQQLVDQITENFYNLIDDLPESKLARLSAVSYRISCTIFALLYHDLTFRHGFMPK